MEPAYRRAQKQARYATIIVGQKHISFMMDVRLTKVLLHFNSVLRVHAVEPQSNRPHLTECALRANFSTSKN